MTHETNLPAGFADLEPWALIWGDLHNQHERYQKRQGSNQAELQAFHAAAAPRLEAVFQHLDKFPLDALPAAEARLFRTILGLTEASQAVEVLNQPRVAYMPAGHSVDIEYSGFQAH